MRRARRAATLQHAPPFALQSKGLADTRPTTRRTAARPARPRGRAPLPRTARGRAPARSPQARLRSGPALRRARARRVESAARDHPRAAPGLSGLARARTRQPARALDRGASRVARALRHDAHERRGARPARALPTPRAAAHLSTRHTRRGDRRRDDRGAVEPRRRRALLRAQSGAAGTRQPLRPAARARRARAQDRRDLLRRRARQARLARVELLFRHRSALPLFGRRRDFRRGHARRDDEPRILQPTRRARRATRRPAGRRRCCLPSRSQAPPARARRRARRLARRGRALLPRGGAGLGVTSPAARARVGRIVRVVRALLRSAAPARLFSRGHGRAGALERPTRQAEDRPAARRRGPGLQRQARPRRHTRDRVRR